MGRCWFRQKIFEEYFFTRRGGVYVRMHNEKLQKVVEEYIYKRDYKYM